MADDLIRFELVSPEKLVLVTEAQQVQVPGAEGDMGILPGHAPVMTTLRPGILEVVMRTGGERRFYVRGGFAEIEPQRITVLAQQSIDVEELNASHLAEEIRNQQENVADARTDDVRQKAEFSLHRLQELQQALDL